MAIHGRTARILTAIEEGAVTPPAISRQIGLPTKSVRESLFRLRRTGRVDRSASGEWATLPHTDANQIQDLLSWIETDARTWSASELATCTGLTIGQIVAITDTLARAGVIERLSAGSYRAIDPDELDRYAL